MVSRIETKVGIRVHSSHIVVQFQHISQTRQRAGHSCTAATHCVMPGGPKRMPCDWAIPRTLLTSLVRLSTSVTRGDRRQQLRVGAAQLGQPVDVVAVVFRVGLAAQPQLPGVGNQHLVTESGDEAAHPVRSPAGLEHHAQPRPAAEIFLEGSGAGGDFGLLEQLAVEADKAHVAALSPMSTLATPAISSFSCMRWRSVSDCWANACCGLSVAFCFWLAVGWVRCLVCFLLAACWNLPCCCLDCCCSKSRTSRWRNCTCAGISFMASWNYELLPGKPV